MKHQILAVVSVAAVVLLMTAAFLWSERVHAAECGRASWYGGQHHGRLMANGKPFNMRAMTTASNVHPLGSVLRVKSGKRSVVVTVSDRGGFGKYGRLLDLSKAAFAKLAPASRGVIPICVTRVR